MKILLASSARLVLQSSRKDETFGENGAFILNIGIIPEKPCPKTLVIQRRVGYFLHTWSISWKKFLNEKAIGGEVVVLRKSHMKFSSRPVR